MTELQITWGAFGAGLTLVAFSAWLERRPRQSLMPRLVPTLPFLFLGVLVALLALIHVLNLSGIQTGR